MSERIFIGVAWPYANGPLHLGHVAGCYLSADIFARYHRVKGNQVLMVSGSDQHGTPITLRAEQEKTTPQQVVDRYHKEFLESWEKLGISFDLFTSTGTANHAQIVQDIFLSLQKKGYIFTDRMPLPYCHTDQRFLPDRYVEGECPYCHYSGARGDQCDKCGKPLNPQELIGLKCRVCGSTPEIRESEHFFLKLSAFESELLEWVKGQTHWRPNVLNFTTQYLKDGLHDRAISRDIEWGVKLPLEGYNSKRIYVWFEAVIGYLSASKEWAQRQGDPEAWRLFWDKGSAKAYYFMGKDNIPFHSIIWPAMLMGYGGLNLPYDIPANEFLTLEGEKISTSRNYAVWLPDYLERYDPDPLRYYLAANMPETSDADFSWKEFVRRNNNELVATYGNLVHRVLTFTYRNFNGSVPDPGELDASSQVLLSKAQNALKETDHHLYLCHFRDGIRVAMSLAQEANRYIDAKAPWRSIKQDRQECARALWTSIAIISTLRTMLYPFLPFSSSKLHALLGGEGKVEQLQWDFQPPPAGHPLREPTPLFTKLDDSVIQEETARLTAPKTP